MWTILCNIFIVILCQDRTTASIAPDARPAEPNDGSTKTATPENESYYKPEAGDHAKYLVESSVNKTCALCQCYSALSRKQTEVIFVDCKSTDAKQIPALPANTTALDLSMNNIVDIKPTSNNVYNGLIFLSLANNKLVNLTSDCFNWFPNLKMLDLSSNKIRYYDIHANAFKSLKQLLFLDIKQDFQDLVLVNESYPDDALSLLTTLQTLAVDGLNQSLPGIGFSKLTNLRELYMSGNYGRCNITELNPLFFQYVRPAQNFSFYLSNCSLRSIEYGTFQNVTNLKALDISWNMDFGFETMKNLTYGMSNTNITFLNFNGLHRPDVGDSCTILQNDHIRHLTNTSVLMILYESNKINGMSNDVYKYIPKTLKYFSVRDNRLVFGEYAKNFIKHQTFNLWYYDTAQMYKTYNHKIIPDVIIKSEVRTTTRKKSVNILNISYTDFRNRCELMFRQKRQLNSFDIILNRVERLQRSKPDLQGNAMKYMNQKEINSYWILRHNRFLPSQIKGKVQYLDVSENLPGIIYFAANVLMGNITNLKLINVSYNYMGYNILDNTGERLFLNSPALKVLDLSNNHIGTIKENAFENLISLETLYLAHNRLTNIDTLNLKRMKTLKYLSLNGNTIGTISKSFRESLENMKNFTINLSNNTLKCSWSNTDFVNWFQISTVHFEDLDTYVCNFDNGSMISMKDFRYDVFNTECSPPTFNTLILVSSLCLMAFLTILCVGLAYRYKWNLRYLFYMTKFKIVGGYQQIRNDDTEFEKEVFISYADEDRGFVRQHVANQLENIGNFSLLVHDRDFLAGQYIGDNIMNAVMSSRKTLVILTQAYIKSKWCLYEMNMARLEGIDTGRDVLCVILKEDIPTEHLPLEILDVIRNKTYLEYPQEVEHCEGFWERLRITLRS